MHVDVGSETERKVKKLNRQKGLLASMRPMRPVKNNPKYGVRERGQQIRQSGTHCRETLSLTSPVPLFLSLPSSTPLSSPFQNNFPETYLRFK